MAIFSIDSCLVLGAKSRLMQTMLPPIYAFLSLLYDFFCGREVRSFGKTHKHFNVGSQ